LEPHKTKFHRRIRREIERLKAQAERLEGPEKEAQLELIEMLEQDHGGADESEPIIHTDEEEAVWTSIILILNRIEHQVRDLRRMLDTDRTWIDSGEVAQRIVDQFSYDCQEAEKLMKFHEKKGHLSPQQRAQLEEQLRAQVETMMALFRRSEHLINAALRSFSAQLLSA
jgi:hypothetical protein